MALCDVELNRRRAESVASIFLTCWGISMRIVLLLAGVFALMFFVAASETKIAERPLKQMADRVEKTEHFPEETRRELTRLIERVNRGPKITAADRQNAFDATRIEQAWRYRSVEPELTGALGSRTP